LRVVVDTNVLVSAFLTYGKPAELIVRLLKDHEVILSNAIVDEFKEVFSDEEFCVKNADVERFLASTLRKAKLVKPISHYKVVSQDPDDNAIINTACKGKANYIVTGDRDLLKIRIFKRTEIVSVTEMMRIVEEHRQSRT